MTPERWEQIKGLFGAVIEQPPERRAAFLAEACAGDADLRLEVERLIAEDDRAREFLNSPPWAEAAESGHAADPKRRSMDEAAANPDSSGGFLKRGDVFAHRYEIRSELGRGGFGIVYSAFDRGPLQRTVALKVIRFMEAEASEPSIFARRRFLEEARVAGNLSHSNIATVFDVAEFEGLVYMTQELAPGRDLRKILAESGPLPIRRVVAIGRQICEGLAHAHARGIVHRDIKPGNIVADGEDRVKITDLGLAQAPHGESSTLHRVVAGTPGYMAPEQLRGERVDGRADIFAVGCVLYQMLTGRPPFEGATAASIIEKTLYSLPAGPSRVRGDLPRSLDHIVGRAMRKDPDERYDNITQLQQDLINYEQFDCLLEAETSATEIAATMEARQCVLFLGLRLPVSIDEKHVRTAENLIAEYLAERLTSPPKERNLARLAQDLEMERGRREMLRHLTVAVRNPRVSPREIIRRVARLPFPVIVTTGYDTFLEEELAKVGRKVLRIVDCQKVPEEQGGGDLLVRLFGSVDSEASIVITEDDLWSFFERFRSLSDALKSQFARHWLLFVGYDPEDEGFRHLFSEIARFRADTAKRCYLAISDMALPTVQWAQRKGLRLIDAEAGSFLALLEERIREAEPRPLPKTVKIRHPGKRWAAIALAGIVLVAGTLGVGLRVSRLWDSLWQTMEVLIQPSSQTPQIRSIAVLPLDNLSADSGQSYLADGMTDQLITDLGEISGLRVISRHSAMFYKGKQVPTPEIARQLNVDAVVEGAVSRVGEQLRVTARLIEAKKDRELWSRTFESEVADVLRMQGEVAHSIVDAIRVKTAPGQESLAQSTQSGRMASPLRVEPDAYDAYQRGQRATSDYRYDVAIKYFQQALAKEPNFALAYAGLSNAYMQMGNDELLSPKESYPKAKDAAIKALAIDDTLVDPHQSLGWAKFRFDWDWFGAEDEYRRALQLNPSSADAHLGLANILPFLGRLDEATAEILRAQELDPKSPDHYFLMGGIYFFSRQYDRAIEQYQKWAEASPSEARFAPSHFLLAESYRGKGMLKEATSELEKAVALPPEIPLYSGHLGYTYGLAGKKAQALKVLEKLKEQAKWKYVAPYDIALVYIGLGDKDQAFTWLEKAYQVRSNDMSNLKQDPTFDSLRSDPRFQDILRRMNFPK